MKKSSVFLNIVHTCFLLASTVSLIVLLVNSQKTGTALNGSPLLFIATLVLMVALLSGALYLVFEHKKQAARQYKIFMLCLVLFEALNILVLASTPSDTMGSLVIAVVALIMIVMLAVSKDLGRTKTILAAIVYGLCKLGVLAADFVSFSNSGANASAWLSLDIAMVLVAATAYVMVIAKYRDKTARGTK